MSLRLRCYYLHWLRWHARLADHVALQRHPAWWC